MPGISLQINTTRLSEGVFDQICQEVFDYCVAISPVDTGFFQDHWEMSLAYPSCTIYNDADYASYLDDGWSSQAPNGVTEPAIEYLKTLANGAQ